MSHCRGQELGVCLEVLPSRIYFKSPSWNMQLIVTVQVRGEKTEGTHLSKDLGLVYTTQVFASNAAPLLWLSLSFT